LANVLENARRHSGGYPVSVRARAVRSFAAGGYASDRREAGSSPAPRDDRVIVRVVDRGPGISPAELDRVFQPFYRARRPAGDDRGSGLGLSIARGFTEANSGSLHAESLPGQGSTFVFELPIGPHEADRPDAPIEGRQDSRTDAGKPPPREPVTLTRPGPGPDPLHAQDRAPVKAKAATPAAAKAVTPATAKASGAPAAASTSAAPHGDGDRAA
jgi:hypothetical protein